MMTFFTPWRVIQSNDLVVPARMFLKNFPTLSKDAAMYGLPPSERIHGTCFPYHRSRPPMFYQLSCSLIHQSETAGMSCQRVTVSLLSLSGCTVMILRGTCQRSGINTIVFSLLQLVFPVLRLTKSSTYIFFPLQTSHHLLKCLMVYWIN